MGWAGGGGLLLGSCVSDLSPALYLAYLNLLSLPHLFYPPCPTYMPTTTPAHHHSSSPFLHTPASPRSTSAPRFLVVAQRARARQQHCGQQHLIPHLPATCTPRARFGARGPCARWRWRGTFCLAAHLHAPVIVTSLSSILPGSLSSLYLAGRFLGGVLSPAAASLLGGSRVVVVIYQFLVVGIGFIPRTLLNKPSLQRAAGSLPPQTATLRDV